MARRLMADGAESSTGLSNLGQKLRIQPLGLDPQYLPDRVFLPEDQLQDQPYQKTRSRIGRCFGPQ